MYTCKYCNKEVGNKGCLTLHERHCKSNPNRIECKGNYGKTSGHIGWNKGLTKETSESIKLRGEKLHQKYLNNEIIPSFLGKHHTEEVKEKISKSRKKYLQEHKDEHVWKRNTKFLSVPCQNLKNKFKELGINFIEELTPFNDYNYSIDIAWPDIKVGIEVNGNQHYNKDGSLVEYYQNRHNIFEERGWKIFEIHYSKCYCININDFNDIFKLDIYDKNYIKEYFDKKEQKTIKQLEYKYKKEKKKESKIAFYKKAIISLEKNSNIDFSKFGWVGKAQEYLKEKFNILLKGNISRFIKEYYPQFFENNNIFIRK